MAQDASRVRHIPQTPAGAKTVHDVVTQPDAGALIDWQRIESSTLPDRAWRLLAALTATAGWHITSDHALRNPCEECGIADTVSVVAEHVAGVVLHFDVCRRCGFTLYGGR